jgi:hypothetical protein
MPLRPHSAGCTGTRFGTRVSGTGEQLRAWARNPYASWPCSELAQLDHFAAAFDLTGDLVDLTPDVDVPADELNAWASECLVRAGYPNHPAIR